MKIWIDADACPGAVKDIIIAAANRRSVTAIFVANKSLSLPLSPFLSFIQVDCLPDAADLYIKDHAEKFDIVITQDIPLAHMLVPADIIVIDPRGYQYTEDNIGDRISCRDLMQGLRDSGEITGGPKQFGNKEKQAFAATFDKALTKILKALSGF